MSADFQLANVLKAILLFAGYLMFASFAANLAGTWGVIIGTVIYSVFAVKVITRRKRAKNKWKVQ